MVENVEPGAYHEVFDDLAGIYLEDSWVLDVRESQGALVFTLDAVLTPDHRAYQAPRAGGQHCYRRAQLHVEGSSAVAFRRADVPPAFDSSLERDYGSIDLFRAVPGERPPLWVLSGDWGEAVVRDPRIRLRLEDHV